MDSKLGHSKMGRTLTDSLTNTCDKCLILTWQLKTVPLTYCLQQEKKIDKDDVVTPKDKKYCNF